MPLATAPQRLSFGAFEFDPAAGELYRLSERVRLQEQPRLLLVALLERPGEIATREDLRDRLWKTDTFVDFDHSLNTAIKKLRHALGDSADAPAFIETVARRGYRFIAPVTTSAPAAPIVRRVVPTRTWRKGALSWILVGVIALTAAAATGIRVMRQRNPVAAAPSQPGAKAQLAVLPLRVLAGTATGDSDYIGVGIADAIITRLANLRQIGLRPTSAVLPYKDAQADPVRIASTLGVQYLLLGTIQPAAATYRISVQLVSSDGVAVWGHTYDEPRGAVLEAQDHIAEQIATSLRVELSPPERARLHARYTESPAAYDLYLRGRALMVNYTEAGMHEAIAYFDRALAIDGRFALARAALATAAAWFSTRYAYESDALAWGKRADDEARRALELDPSLADAHVAIASAAGTLYGGFDWKVVLERTATALALDPSADIAHVVRMRAFYHTGFFDEAREQARLARALNPFPSVETARLTLAIELFSGQFAGAAEQAVELLRRTDAPVVRHYLGLARYYMGDAAGARQMLASATRGGRPDVRAQASLASIEAAEGLLKEARARSAAVVAGPYMDHHVAYSVGAAFAQLGDPAQSVKWLQAAADTGFSCYPWFQRDTLLDPIRRDPRFAQLLDRLRTSHERTNRRTP